MDYIPTVQLPLVSSMTRQLSWVYSIPLPLEMAEYECSSFNTAEAKVRGSSFLVSPKILPLGSNYLKVLCVSHSISREQKIPSFKWSSLLRRVAEVISPDPQNNKPW